MVSDFELYTKDNSSGDSWKLLSLRKGAVPRKHSIVTKFSDEDKTVINASVAWNLKIHFILHNRDYFAHFVSWLFFSMITIMVAKGFVNIGGRLVYCGITMPSSLHLEDLGNFVTTTLYIYHSLPGMLGLVNMTRAISGVVRTRPISERPAPPRRWKTQRPRKSPPYPRVITPFCIRSSYNYFLKRKETPNHFHLLCYNDIFNTARKKHYAFMSCRCM